ncbi:Serine/threonine-protein kinase PknB [Anatilimnocola aggregata]|uniref:Serine/threonine-protein kinase PknB n=1 Tax=Anatilimnocola aggregata TaxID=2528021 RepID=A0A517Y927_9BACT|nr:serine/threonine-protein kinase [Anatilimnocola aggregata]QDU26723.1 Serine/threonine-protein kinase PknB [Anatilimnocola aggregata]
MNDPNNTHDGPKGDLYATRSLDTSLASKDKTDCNLVEGKVVPDKPAASPSHIQSIGRYRIDRVLGKGGFGLVYLAHDEQLQRHVAIKVAHRERVLTASDAEAYLIEARTVANLDHPHIVPVHDVGSTSEFPCFIVSKFIEGSTLAARIQSDRPKPNAAAELIATVAEALHYAHRKGLVHRDIKPGNILIDASGKPFVVDFGLALKEENIGRGPKYAGTPAYMSPEQARGEGHRVDGRSDIFSLGTVFYELLIGRRPFQGDSQAELLDQISTFEPRPPRQYDDSIPKELERICLKTLSKRASDRYSTAKDLAEDLRHFVIQQSGPVTNSRGAAGAPVWQPPSSARITATPAAHTTQGSNSQFTKIVPKGLRSFDAHDADFFLELLPGPRDRDGLPNTIRFWKNRIEEQDTDKTFAVGLIYGPSGCGKSSLVKAGLLPRLSEHVTAVYIEAAAYETESRLLNGLRKHCPALDNNLSLKETLVALRRGQGLPAGKKVLLVLDQFEQWLHANTEEQNTELVQSLRQCDGGRLQCVVMVRDDFWMAATRFMRELEVRLVEAENSAAVDLFPIRHAEKVLAAFGRAFGVLPEVTSDASEEQQQFLKQATASLAQEGKVISVRLALFAEMMKGRNWTPATLKAVGGTEGVGVTFLEETFSAATAPPEHRYHQKAARNVLKSLLPESGTDIKGHMLSAAGLLDASGYQTRTQDFADLLRVLDSEIRLITPTDPEGQDHEAAETQSMIQAGQKYYQLTHDYLVPSLREWLTRKQKETRRGRAELLLAERAALWMNKAENRHLPSFLEYLAITFRTNRASWNPAQTVMLKKASRQFLLRAAMLLALAALMAGVTISLVKGFAKQRDVDLATATVLQIRDAVPTDVPKIVRQSAVSASQLEQSLTSQFDGFTETSRFKFRDRGEDYPDEQLSSADDLLRKRFNIRFAFQLMREREAPGQPQRENETALAELVCFSSAKDFSDMMAVLKPYRSRLQDNFWKILESDRSSEEQRFRAACAFAQCVDQNSFAKKYVWDQSSASYVKYGDWIAAKLIPRNERYWHTWRDALEPANTELMAGLQRQIDTNHNLREANLARAKYLAEHYRVMSLPISAAEKELILESNFDPHAGHAH